MRRNVREPVIRILAITVVSLMLVGCVDKSEEISECQEILSNAVLSADGVDGAQFMCIRDFGNPGESGTVTLDVDTQRDATPVIENVYKALAREQGIDDSWKIYMRFMSSDGRIFSDDFLDFNGDPTMADIRERYHA